MEIEERRLLLDSAMALERREKASHSFIDPYSDMTTEEKSRLLILQQRMLDEKDAQAAEAAKRYDSLVDKMDRMLAKQDESALEIAKLHGIIVGQAEQIGDFKKENQKLQQQLDDALATIASMRKDKFKGTSQKSRRKDKDGDRRDGNLGEIDHQQRKADFDGNPESIGDAPGCSQCAAAPAQREQASSSSDEEKKKVRRLYRLGMEYRTMAADKDVLHKSDEKKLPAGAKVLKRYLRYAYDQQTIVTEHQYQTIRYKLPDGTIHEGYFPCDGEPEVLDVVPGTHASSSMMAYLVYNHYELDTPVYREIKRIMSEKMTMSRMTIHNWLYKSCLFAKEVMKLLMELALEKDSYVNCDETWNKVRIEIECEGSKKKKYRKRYMWCLVNRKARIVIYVYEEGSRGRDALKTILGDHKIKALQSDGYNVYMYLDDKLVDIEHLCCMAHSRAKFVYAAEQGNDPVAQQFVDIIGELYQLEREYENGLLTSEQILLARKSLKTQEIIGRLRSLLDVHTRDDHPPRGELMEKALAYLKKYWNQLFAYLHDGDYTIDNSIAERYIRPYSGERKNCLFYGSHKMARVSAVFHTLISTCHAQGLSALNYLKAFFGAIAQGRRDYENLTPMALCR